MASENNKSATTLCLKKKGFQYFGRNYSKQCLILIIWQECCLEAKKISVFHLTQLVLLILILY